MYKTRILMGYLITLLGCTNKVAIDPDKSDSYVKDNKTGEVYCKCYYLDTIGAMDNLKVNCWD